MPENAKSAGNAQGTGSTGSRENDEAFSSIEGLRAEIDALDAALVGLLNKRAEHALAIRALKPKAQLGLFDPRREEEIFERVSALNEGPLYGDDLRAIYEAILRVSKEMRG
ncbi:MAG: chorismate mutase [Coriobacteriales bacterium]|jgi:chorismate mutase|nr:chorismate mutase [Coriobacteriales bacterium]